MRKRTILKASKQWGCANCSQPIQKGDEFTIVDGILQHVVRHNLRTILEENMEICKSCDHNVKLECKGGCFSPHSTPPCFRQAMESQTTAVQQLKAEIAATVAELKVYKYHGGDPEFVRLIAKLERQLSAV